MCWLSRKPRTRCSFHPLSFSYGFRDHLNLHSFPTRRSSDLAHLVEPHRGAGREPAQRTRGSALPRDPLSSPRALEDRKSTRLNSSHTVISYAVFCLKKKTGPRSRKISATSKDVRDISASSSA